MTVVIAEVADLLKLVADGIGNVRSIVDAARDGYTSLTKNHPNAQTDLANLLDEIGKLTEYLADASSIVTSFAFTVSETELGRQPDRFNDLLRKRQAGVLARFDAQLGATRAHSSEIGMYGIPTATGSGEERDAESVRPSEYGQGTGEEDEPARPGGIRERWGAPR